MLGVLAEACGDVLRDLHVDPDHHRSVFTLAGPGRAVEAAARSLAGAAVEALDLSRHEGAHPRFGVLDVVPFVPLADPGPLTAPAAAAADLGPAVAARDAFASWAAATLGLPCFLYGPLAGGGARSLPEVRRGAFVTLAPDCGPVAAHPTAGAVAVGARPLLVAYNLWLEGADVAVARAVAAALRGPSLRALGLALGPGVQVSCNLLDPLAVGPADVYDRTAALLRPDALGACGARIRRAELVGLVPAALLDAVDPARWEELDLSPDRAIESRLGRPPPPTR